MRNVLCIIILALAVLMPTAQAQVFKCAGAGGKPVYSDRPCENGDSGTMLERRKTWQEISRERSIAAEAEQRKYRERSDQREQHLFEEQMRLSRQQQAAQAQSRQQPQSETAACKAAKKELAFVSNIRTVSQDEKRMRTNAAISNVNAACGSNTQLMQEPPKIIRRPRHFIDQHGRSCTAFGDTAQCN